MVLPWLIVGATAAFELRRRNEPDTKDRELQQLREQKQAITKQRQAVLRMCEAKTEEIVKAQATQEDQERTLKGLEEMKAAFEERLSELDAYAEDLQKRNDALNKENILWKERADAYLSQNIQLKGEAETLRLENGELKGKLEEVLSSSSEKIAEMQAMIEDVKQSVQSSLSDFSAGDCDAATLQQRLLDAGVQVALKPDELERLRSSPESAKNLEAIVGREFTAQLPFVLDDHDRIKNFMGIAQRLRANGEATSTSSEVADDSASAAPLTRDTSGHLSSAPSEAEVANAKSLGVQSQSSVTSSVMGLMDRWSFGSRAVSEKAAQLDSDRLLANSVAAAAANGRKAAGKQAAGPSGAAITQGGPFPAVAAQADEPKSAGLPDKSASKPAHKKQVSVRWSERKNVKTKIEGGKRPSGKVMDEFDLSMDSDSFGSKALTRA